MILTVTSILRAYFEEVRTMQTNVDLAVPCFIHKQKKRLHYYIRLIYDFLCFTCGMVKMSTLLPRSIQARQVNILESLMDSVRSFRMPRVSRFPFRASVVSLGSVPRKGRSRRRPSSRSSVKLRSTDMTAPPLVWR